MGSRETSWTLIHRAQGGDAAARDEFASRYAPAVRAYFSARWHAPPLVNEVDDAVQEVFLDCLRDDGALGRCEPGRPFRPFLYGVARTIALRFEQRRGPPDPLGDRELEARETRLSVAFDRTFAVQVMREATELQRSRALVDGGVRLRRVELLEMRFRGNLSIAEIAAAWKEEPSRVHHLYADAREDFRDALREIVAGRSGVASADLERECEWMLEVLRRDAP
jgi:RNA polymerase sigma factor (sigma-70 family)